MRRNEIQPGLRAFTVGIEGPPDLKNAAVMAAHLGVPHAVAYNTALQRTDTGRSRMLFLGINEGPGGEDLQAIAAAIARLGRGLGKR